MTDPTAPAPALTEAALAEAADWVRILTNLGEEPLATGRPLARSRLDAWVTQHFRALLDLAREALSLRAEIAKLQDPAAVHAGMLAGRIARPSIRQLVHLTGSVPAEDAQLAEIAALREQVKELEAFGRAAAAERRFAYLDVDDLQADLTVAQAEAARLRAALDTAKNYLGACLLVIRRGVDPTFREVAAKDVEGIIAELEAALRPAAPAEKPECKKE